MVDPKSPLTADPVQTTAPLYSDEEIKYIGQLMARMLNAQVNRDKSHPELENKTFLEYYNDNERIGNTWTPKREFDDGIVVASGTVEKKLFDVAAEINRLNLSPEVRVFDQADTELYAVGMALTDAIYKTEKIEQDREKKLHRLVELLKQGTCFVQETWTKQYKKEKTLNTPFNGKIKASDWSEKVITSFDGPKRNILYAPGVYLGDVHCLNSDDQPFVFTIKTTSYAEAESRYGQKDTDGKPVWERWENVSKIKTNIVTQENVGTINVNDGFQLLGINENQVEEIHYMDRFNDEYQILLNGVAMLPTGFPLSAIFPGGRLPITYQVLQPINSFFAYGRSFCTRNRRVSDLLDEILRLLILKTRKSIHPPYANISGKVISQKSLMPGRITMGIDPNALQKIGDEGVGVTTAEFQMYDKLNENIDKNTVSPQFQGMQGKSGTTAFEVNVLQKQAEKVLSLTVFAFGLLEQKIAYLRLDNVIGRWMDPIGESFDETRQTLIKKFRPISRDIPIEGRGMGSRQTILTQEPLPQAGEIMDSEDFQGTPDATFGRRKTRQELGMKPIQQIYLNPEELRKSQSVFFIEVDSKEDDTSATARVNFMEELRNIQALMALGSQPNVEALQEEFSKVFNKRAERIFQPPQAAPTMAPGGQGGPPNLESILNQNTAGAPTAQ